MIRTLSSNIAQSWISAEVQAHVWVVPAVQSVHILAISALVFTSFSVSFSTIRQAATAGSIPWLQESFRWTWLALLVLLISGAILLIGEPTRSFMNVYFRLKLVLVVLASVLTLMMQRALLRPDRMRFSSPVLMGLAGLSVATWVAILFCGRFIAYFGDLAN